MFIRAPAILKVGSNVEVLAHVTSRPHPHAKEEVYKLLNIDTTTTNDDDGIKVIVGIKQKNILATAFHPELTDDKRWHQYFISMVIKYKEST